MKQRRVLRTREASEYVALSTSNLEKMRARGRGPRFIRLGKRAVGYRIEDLDAWLDGRSEGASQPSTEERLKSGSDE